MEQSEKRLLKVLRGERTDRPPIWLMRQAGRYLPEYREVRQKARDFLDFCYSPDLATEVTHQPLRRYPLDAAILFADILLLPDALGQTVTFKEGIGPVLEPIRSAEAVDTLKRDRVHKHLEPVYETVRRLRASLDPHVTLIGFAGAPWTVATYMVGGRGSQTMDEMKTWVYGNEDAFARLMDILVESTTEYLSAQVDAGAEVLQLFDSWAGALSTNGLQRWCLEPTRRIVAALKEKHPSVPIIGFPRQVGPFALIYARESGVDAVGIDTGMDVVWARDALQPVKPVQGNLDPMALVAGGDALKRECETVLDALGSAPYIFNLGHGIVPQTPPEHVSQLMEIIEDWSCRQSTKPTLRDPARNG